MKILNPGEIAKICDTMSAAGKSDSDIIFALLGLAETIVGVKPKGPRKIRVPKRKIRRGVGSY